MVVLDANETLLAFSIVRTGPRAQMGAQAALEDVCKQLNIKKEDFAAIVATGYGRNNIPFATDTRTEITCHARGAHFLNPAVRTIIDIGGQDSKIINLDETGHVTGFMMNDKCAAGTGRFLEMMARTLELDMAEMSRRGLTWDKELTISSMCTVFAESEVISLIADNHTDSDIIHGLNKSIAGKTAAMAARAKGQPPYMMTGGAQPRRCAGAGREAGRKALDQRKPGSVRRARRGALRPARRLILLAPRGRTRYTEGILPPSADGGSVNAQDCFAIRHFLHHEFQRGGFFRWANRLFRRVMRRTFLCMKRRAPSA